jgi:hypothetical protein
MVQLLDVVRQHGSPTVVTALRRATARAVVTTVALAGSALATLVVEDLTRPAPPPVVEQVDAVSRLMAEKRCSTQGLPDGAVPASALIRDRAGNVRQVTFDRGWAVHRGDRPGTLVAVCRVPLP